jgi:hypothetical protein
MIIILTDKASIIKATLDSTSGFLTAPVTLARVGVQHYRGFELGIEDRANELIGVFRSPEEVFHADSITSYTNLVVTNNHPKTPVNTSNVKSLQVGSVSGVNKSGTEVLDGIVTITDSAQIKQANGGKLEVSVGYKQDLIPMIGDYNGEKYEFAQTKIRANHLAIVDAGRCGSACKITLDDKGKEAMLITIDGIQYEVEDSQLGQAILKQQDAFEKKEEVMKKKLEETDEEKEKAVKEKEKEKAKADALEQEKTTADSGLAALVSDRAALIVQAQQILGDKMPKCMDCPQEIKLAVADAVYPDMDMTDQSDAYVDAVYDLAVKSFSKAKGSIASLSKDFQTDAAKTAKTRDSARAKYVKDQLNAEEV